MTGLSVLWLPILLSAVVRLRRELCDPHGVAVAQE